MASGVDRHYSENVVTNMVVENNCPWVSVTPATADGLAWRCTKVLHLSGAENNGRRNILIELVIGGMVIHQNDGLAIKWGWDGQHADEAQPLRKLDKNPPDPSTDIAIDPDQHIWLEVVDKMGFPSDRVSNIHAELVSNGPGNEYHHNSTRVRLELMKGDAVQPPVVTEPLSLESLDRRVKALEGK